MIVRIGLLEAFNSIWVVRRSAASYAQRYPRSAARPPFANPSDSSQLTQNFTVPTSARRSPRSFLISVDGRPPPRLCRAGTGEAAAVACARSSGAVPRYTAAGVRRTHQRGVRRGNGRRSRLGADRAVGLRHRVRSSAVAAAADFADWGGLDP